MKHVFFGVLAIHILAAFLLAQQTAPAETGDKPQTDKEKISYSLGVNFGKNLKGQGLELDYRMLAIGLKDGAAGTQQLTDQEIQAILRAYQQQRVAQKMEEQKQLAQKNKADGEAFMKENASRPGVVTLPSGLQYRILKEGAGPRPKATDSVKTHYIGRLLDGTVFDNSYDRKEASTFPLEGVIPGWIEALQLMPVGSKWEIVVPPQLAYGEKAMDKTIGPNSTLIFEIELLGIEEE